MCVRRPEQRVQACLLWVCMCLRGCGCKVAVLAWCPVVALVRAARELADDVIQRKRFCGYVVEKKRFSGCEKVAAAAMSCTRV